MTWMSAGNSDWRAKRSGRRLGKRRPQSVGSRRAFVEQLESRRLLAADGVLSSLTNLSEVAGAEGEGSASVRFRLETADAAGVPTEQFGVGETIQLRVYTEDVRATPLGVFAAYLDITYDTALVDRAGAPAFSAPYDQVLAGDSSQDGLLDEYGASSSSIAVLGGDEFLVFTQTFTATAAGSFEFASDDAEATPLHDVLVYGLNDPVPNSQVSYDTASVEIVDVRVVDDGDVGYSETGAEWGSGGLSGAFHGDYRFHQPGQGDQTATWRFAGLPSGTYEVFSTWMPFENRASNATFSLLDGATLEETVQINQQQAPDDLIRDGNPWESLGVIEIDNGSLSVMLSDAADGVVIADAIRIETSTELPAPPPTPNPTPTAEPIIDNGDTGYGETGAGWSAGGLAGAYQGDYRFHHPGSGDEVASWTFSGIADGDYEVYATWTAHENRASNARFQIRDGSNPESTAVRDQRQAPDDLSFDGQNWERLGTASIDQGSLTVSLDDGADGVVIADAIYIRASDGVPSPPPPVPPTPPVSTGATLVDDGDSAYTQTGGAWGLGGLAGAHEGDYRYHAAGSGEAVASWQFDVANGHYEVFATWTAFENRATNAPFLISDGGVAEHSQRLNQQIAADDLFADGHFWESLGEVEINQASLTVQLSNDADGIVIADAVRIMPLAAAPAPASVDDGDANYAEQGMPWRIGGISGGHAGDYRFLPAGAGANKAIWQASLSAGTYQLFATWTAFENRASNATYVMLDGTTPVGTSVVDQRLEPDDSLDAGYAWELLGTVTTTGGVLSVELSDLADGVVIADAVRFVSV